MYGKQLNLLMSKFNFISFFIVANEDSPSNGGQIYCINIDRRKHILDDGFNECKMFLSRYIKPIQNNQWRMLEELLKNILTLLCRPDISAKGVLFDLE